ncbi:MAG TPA: TlyA family rRNA (cytidine-2'-O)-methyltransferase [Chloroflexi bacterium]|nr:TlyA family rRNA (cytidine-2'-O)-methyltransferase [Chloroflexota bacterium]HHW87277.1 TlyA family RNA methyltransferase [Chloroflexota bacterium]
MSEKKERLDLLLVARGLATSREQAQRLIMAGEVEVNGVRHDKPGRSVAQDAAITVRAPLPYVSRGGLKLAAALDAFALDVTGLLAADVGASTGGFTDCLLQRGAARVYAIDVGYGQLAWKLQSDPRVVVLDRTNVRHLEALPDGVLADLAVIDASFISLTLVLPATLRLLKPDGQVIALIKPQFEAGADQVGKGGVVRDPKVHRRVLAETCALAASLALTVAGLTVSPAPGPAGNIEFLIWLRRSQSDAPPSDPERLIDAALSAAQQLRRREG